MTERRDTPSKADEIWNEFTRTNNDGIAIFAFPKALSAIRQLERELAAVRSETAALAKDAARYRNIREHGIPCSQGDDCGSCTGDELDEQTDDAIAHPEKYDV